MEKLVAEREKLQEAFVSSEEERNETSRQVKVKKSCFYGFRIHAVSCAIIWSLQS